MAAVLVPYSFIYEGRTLTLVTFWNLRRDLLSRYENINFDRFTSWMEDFVQQIPELSKLKNDLVVS